MLRLLILIVPQPIGQGSQPSNNLRYQAYEMRKQNMTTPSNMNAASELKQMMNQQNVKKKNDDSDEEAPDDVR